MEMLNKIFSTAQIAAIDKYTIEHEPISSLELMERAAGLWTERFVQFFPLPAKVVIVAGNGNNGGDGYAIARLLTLQHYEVMVYGVGEAELSPDGEENCRRWLEIGGKWNRITISEEFDVAPEAVLIDALFGSGLNRKVSGLAAEVIRKMNALPNQVVAVDIPSGLMGEDNSGNDVTAIVQADYTFTFQFPKLAFFLPENAGYVGHWQVIDIGLDQEAIKKTPTAWFYTTKKTIEQLLPSPAKYAHKGINGRGVLIAGKQYMMGAAILAARAALHSGIGLLYCHVPAKGGEIMQIAVPEAILDPDLSEVCFSGMERVENYNAIAVGPGLGQSPETVEGLKKLLQQGRGITILDADALNIIAQHRGMLDLLHDQCILTPHMKEFERLAGKSRNDFDRLNKLGIFANRYQVYVVLKGAHSVVATPDGRLFFNMSGNPGMAKGGAGDVLTGVLLGLAANGLEMLDIVRIGVFAHGLAGDLLAARYGYRGISAGMIADALSETWNELEAFPKIEDRIDE